MARDTSLRTLLNPLTVPRLALRALDDLNSLADVARRDPHPMEELASRADEIGKDLEALVEVARGIQATGQEIIVGGDDLRRTGVSLDGTAAEIRDGGEELRQAVTAMLEVAQRLLGHLPALEDSVDTVAETMEPLQKPAEKVGKLSNALSRDG
jgi:methyl-accepting chemotaxis protein